MHYYYYCYYQVGLLPSWSEPAVDNLQRWKGGLEG